MTTEKKAFKHTRFEYLNLEGEAHSKVKQQELGNRGGLHGGTKSLAGLFRGENLVKNPGTRAGKITQ